MAVYDAVVIAQRIQIDGHQVDRIKAVLLSQSLMSAILGITYHSFVDSRGPVSSASSLIGWSANFG